MPKDGQIIEDPAKYCKAGTLMRSGTFSDGVQVGEWITYRRNAEVVGFADFGPKGN